MGQIKSVLGPKYINLKLNCYEETEKVGLCAFDTILSKNVPHILEMIFLSLDFESYNKCLEVNDKWKKLLTSESYNKKGRIVFWQELYDLEAKLGQASEEGNVLRVRKLLSFALVDVNSAMIWGDTLRTNTPLNVAAFWGHQGVVKALLDGGANPYKEDAFGFTALEMAVLNNEKDVIRLLTSAGTDPNVTNSTGNTPLHTAMCTRSSIYKVLLELGAELDKTNGDGNTPLHLAALEGNKKKVKFLLQKGADRTKRNEAGHTPLSLACESMNPNIPSKVETVRILMHYTGSA